MKTIFSFLGLFMATSLAFSQVKTVGTVTIDVTGNRTKQIAVDNQYYTITNSTLGEKQTVVINTLQNGQYPLEIVRRNTSNKTVTTKTSFTLREGYDLNIAINQNGTVSTTEKRIESWIGGVKKPISTAAYNKLYAATKAKTTSAARTSHLEIEFTSTSKMFTSSQASKLIQLVNTESLRLRLAKQVYTKITDKENFSLVSALLYNNANRTELDNYTASLPDDDDDDDGDQDVTGVNTPLTNEKFKNIYDEVSAENTVSERNYYLLNFFSKDFNNYTSLQASQLIQLVTSETERFNLAKTAYRGVTDKENYSLVYQLLNNSSNRADLLAYINSYNNTNVKTAITAANFNKLYQSASYQNSTTGRYNSVNTSFSTPGNYFTVAQAKQLIQLVNSESHRLALTKTAYKVLVDPSNYTQFNDLLNSTASRNELSYYVANYNNGYNTGSGNAMTDMEFNNLYKNVNDAWSSSTRVNLVANAFNNTANYFTVYQVRQLLSLINTEADRFTMAKSSYDNLVDKSNFSQLYDLFATTSNRDALARFATDMQNGGTVTVKTPMSDADFNTISRNIQFTFGLGAKMGALTNIFNDETNYFTVLQAKKLIEMVSAEYNRLELAKLSFNNLTDPANFKQLYDIFSSQASKDELDDYMSKNSYTNN